MIKNLVIVESPGKIKKIQGFLGKDYKVVASYGHICDLDKGAKGIDKKNNFEPHYIVSKDKETIVKDLKKLVKESEKIYLAQDQDREGESISYHLKEFLNIPEKKYERIVFQEITKQAIEDALKNTRKIDMNLVNAQQARRVLDRLVGFGLSPLLWKKIQLGLSAGRVQSVAVRLIVEKDKEINSFESFSDFKIVGMFDFKDNKGKTIPIKSILNKRFKTKENAQKFLESCIKKDFFISSVEKKPGKKSPQAPFTTSTMQQIANRSLGFSVDRTMKAAQKLYENGHITYMRTDSVTLSEEILRESKNEIEKVFGKKYSNQRVFKTKSKSAQEAHEAIRPTHIENHTVNDGDDERRLYELIWKRTMASQMSDAEFERTVVEISSKDINEKFISKGEVLKFDGFLSLYKYEEEKSDEDDADEENKSLPPLKTNDKLSVNEISAIESYKKPPPRYSESSLVKKLEEIGVGRPSTYASIISTIQKRKYVTIDDKPAKERVILNILLKNDRITETKKTENYASEKKKMFPTDIGIAVNDFLVGGFDDIVNYNFTASAENEFDEIAKGKKVWNKMISDFYTPFSEKIKTSSNKEGKTSERYIGDDPTTGKKVLARIGRYGPMVQLGEKDDVEELKYSKLKENQSMHSITLEEALELLKWPRNLGKHEKEDVTVAIGKFGPYVKYKSKFYSLKDIAPEKISLKQAIEVINEKNNDKSSGTIKEFKNQDIKVLNGKFGPYISKKGKNYKIPETKEATKITLAECLEIIKNKKNYKKK